MTSMLKAAFFDVDGTLVDSNQFHVLAWAEVLHAAGHDFRFSELHAQIGKGADNYLAALLPDASPAEKERLAAGHARLFRDRYADRVRPFPEAQALLRRCREVGLGVYLVTSASREEVDRHVASLGAQKIIDGFVDSDAVSHSKPCPDLFVAALDMAGVRPENAIVIGDSPHDVDAAKRARLDAIAVRSGLFTDEQLRGAIALYDDVADLLRQFGNSPLGTRP